jgi:hemerythrin-like metal-binding protein
MDTRFEWREEYDVGVEVIDQEHRRLFRIIDKLFRFKAEEKDSQWTCQEGIKFFKGHAVKHFADEESYMASIGYEGLEQHRRIHRDFRANILPALEQELEQSGYAPDAVEHFLGVCTGWLIGHTLTEDQAITGKRTSSWESLLPGEELAAMKKVIIQLLFDMFRLESQVISDAYSGEKFGKGVYYRLVYGGKKEDQRQEVLLVFEEKLLINTVGRIMGLQTNKLDSMLIHAARYTARQFVARLMEHFPNMKDYELKEENLLSYEQFQKLFEREQMQVSLLFNTGGAGYFSYCVIAPHLLENGVGTPIEQENALTEVEQYLMKREEQAEAEEENPKLRILVVDDSMTIRHSMKQLLEKEYDVALAESGVAAIRTITLNRPDLVLLDYEMPVCDGKQTLQMLRSEKSFSDIPVIFLTGRDDPEIVKALLSLKPAGYLLKYLKPAEIKEKIDAFLAKKAGKKA